MSLESFSRFLWSGLLVAGLVASTATAKADAWDKKTVVTFNEAVEIPGMVLPAGTYVMRLVDSQSDRDIVQFLNKNQTHVYNTVLAIPDYREEPTGRTVITFEERAAGSPRAIRSWFYPGDLYGDEFIYPKIHPVAMTTAAVTPPAPVTPAPKPQPQAQAAPAPVPTPAPQPVHVAKAAPAPPAPAPAPAPQSAPAKELPKTGSELPLIGLLGSLAVITGAVLNRRSV